MVEKGGEREGRGGGGGGGGGARGLEVENPIGPLPSLKNSYPRSQHVESGCNVALRALCRT